MYKILLKITSKTKAEGIAKGKYVNKFLIGFLSLFIVYLVGLMILKAVIFRNPN